MQSIKRRLCPCPCALPQHTIHGKHYKQRHYPCKSFIVVRLVLSDKSMLTIFNLQVCLFGEHQLIWENTNKPIAHVENAKTTFIMTGFYPGYIWMATNGSANLNPTTLKPLLYRNVIHYPDLGQFEKWNIKVIELQKHCSKITTSNLLETNATPVDHKSGLDIAD